MKLNTTHDVFRALADGKKVRRLDWHSSYIHLTEDGKLIDSNGYSYTWDDSAIDVWELYEEPKKMKQVWQWRYKHKAHLYWNVCGILAASAEETLKYVTDNSDNWEVAQHSGPYEVPE